jgi:hypothetical protein
MPLTRFELHGQVAFIVDQAREVVGVRVQLRQVAVCVVGDGPGRGRGGIPPGKTPPVADRDEAVRAASSGVVRVGQVVDERRRVVAALQRADIAVAVVGDQRDIEVPGRSSLAPAAVEVAVVRNRQPRKTVIRVAVAVEDVRVRRPGLAELGLIDVAVLEVGIPGAEGTRVIFDVSDVGKPPPPVVGVGEGTVPVAVVDAFDLPEFEPKECSSSGSTRKNGTLTITHN